MRAFEAKATHTLKEAVSIPPITDEQVEELAKRIILDINDDHKLAKSDTRYEIVFTDTSLEIWNRSAIGGLAYRAIGFPRHTLLKRMVGDMIRKGLVQSTIELKQHTT